MRVRWALRTLRDSDQQVLRLVVGEGLTIRQAAVVLGCRPVTARVRLRRARARLAAALAAAEASRRCALKVRASRPVSRNLDSYVPPRNETAEISSKTGCDRV
jgi:hypothetical protein